MQAFNVINYDFNGNKFESYDVMHYLVNAYNNRVEKSKEYPDSDYWKVPKTFDEFKEFVREESKYQFWARCEYEVILVDWPCQKIEKKIDVDWQIRMNLDLITRILMENVL